MLSAIKIELIVLKRYLVQIFGLSLVVAAFLIIGMGSAAAAPGLAMTMVALSGCLAGAAYDEQGGWGAFRLTAPFSRRDVVIARYATVAVAVLAGAIAGMVVVCGLWGISQAIELPRAVGAALAMDATRWAVLKATVVAGLLTVAVITGIAIPLAFRTGSTTAQLTPIYLFVVFMGIGGGLNVLGIDLESAMVAFKEWSIVPGNAVLLACGLITSALAIWAISAAVSFKLYAARDL